MAGLFSFVPSGLLGGQCPPYIWSVAVPTMNGGAIFIRPFGTPWWAMPTLHLVRSATGGSALADQLPVAPRRFETEFSIYRAKSTAAERSGFQRKIPCAGRAMQDGPLDQASQPSRRDSKLILIQPPSDESLGYSRMSLRDKPPSGGRSPGYFTAEHAEAAET